MRRLIPAALLLSAILTPTSAPAVAVAATPPLIADPAYYRPVEVDGRVFPVARSNFFSQLYFDDGWHDPRFRLVDGKWLLVGVHEGIDIVCEKGTPLVAYMDGVVENVGWTFYSGMRIGIRGEDGKYYFYAHTSEEFVREGQAVSAGDLIARAGNTGYGPEGTEDHFVPHLHFGIEAGDEWQNPYPVHDLRNTAPRLRRCYRT
ncbi:MAG: M23 family metallopeptidase [Actinobacteria bacterium]|nr:M23 family metallopeptidase [Actinomycetota bacterium]